MWDPLGSTREGGLVSPPQGGAGLAISFNLPENMQDRAFQVSLFTFSLVSSNATFN